MKPARSRFSTYGIFSLIIRASWSHSPSFSRGTRTWQHLLRFDFEAVLWTEDVRDQQRQQVPVRRRDGAMQEERGSQDEPAPQVCRTPRSNNLYEPDTRKSHRAKIPLIKNHTDQKSHRSKVAQVKNCCHQKNDDRLMENNLSPVSIMMVPTYVSSS